VTLADRIKRDKELDNKTLALIIELDAKLEILISDGVPDKLEEIIDWDIIEDCRAHLQMLHEYQPDTSESPAEFERNGGYGLSAAERNK